MKVLLLFFVLLLPATVPLTVFAQDSTSDRLFGQVRVEETPIGSLDGARKIIQMDATPDGKHWFAVDEFANWRRMIYDGHVIEPMYHEIAKNGTALSPNGDYLIWTGLMRATTTRGLDSTMATVYKGDSILGSFVGDFPVIEFSRTGDHWALLLPYAFQKQTGDRDIVMVDGKVAAKGEVFPHQFSFSHDETMWAYRATDGLNEKIVTSEGVNSVLFKRTESGANGNWDATVWRYTPDVTVFGRLLEGRDYDLKFEHVARQYRTAYSLKAADTARTYITYNGKAHDLYRWVNNVVIDTAGQHIAYFACDPAITRRDTGTSEHRGVVVYDGKVVAGPYVGISRLFLSPSGKHYAYSLSKEATQFFIDKKLAAKTSQVMDCVWSPDESKLAYSVVGLHDKLFVVVNGKRSPLYEQLGRVGWDAKGKSVKFVGVKNGRLVSVTMPA